MSSTLQPLPPIDVRLRLSALWTATMIIVAFVDIFGLFRADLREQIEAGSVFMFEIGQPFMLGIVLYVMIPTLMIAASIFLPWRANRLLNIIVAALFAITIVGAAIGEWGYYLVASGVELGLLAVVIVLAARWQLPPKLETRN
ncbi:DUF6326 family protein [Microbacterium sp. NPDC076911]|uniref:DUF6326 family protein n=1 Tax=Microbacterium sp. NPDC076911 TaxID=3154958 RepID=UPI0034269563